MSTIETVCWESCYDQSWRGDITDEAFAHPAKFARGLIERIADYVLANGGGTCIVSSPPFLMSEGGGRGPVNGWNTDVGISRDSISTPGAKAQRAEQYGQTPGQLGSMPPGTPPPASQQQPATPEPPQANGEPLVVVDPFGGVALGGIVFASRGVRWYGCELEAKFVELAKQNFGLHAKTWESFGDPLPVIVQGDSRQLRAVLGPVLVDAVVSSPPYSATGVGDVGNYKSISSIAAGSGDLFKAGGGRKEHGDNYGSTPGNLGNLPAGNVDAVVSSPPFEGTHQGTDAEFMDHVERTKERGAPISGRRTAPMDYGETEGNIGNETGATFWDAARDIVAESYAILRPGGLAVWVCKDFVRKGKRVPFSDDWARLCTSQGFQLVEWVQASLVKRDVHPGLFGEDVVKTTERKSFFRRLAEKKGSPPIDHEDVLIMRRPSGGGGSVDAIVSSPPYAETAIRSGQDNAARVRIAKELGVSTDKVNINRTAKLSKDYGDTPGNLGNLPPGKIEDALTQTPKPGN